MHIIRNSNSIPNKQQKEKEQEVKFDWFSSSENDIREEVARILKARESGSG